MKTTNPDVIHMLLTTYPLNVNTHPQYPYLPTITHNHIHTHVYRAFCPIMIISDNHHQQPSLMTALMIILMIAIFCSVPAIKIIICDNHVKQSF